MPFYWRISFVVVDGRSPSFIAEVARPALDKEVLAAAEPEVLARKGKPPISAERLTHRPAGSRAVKLDVDRG